MHKAGGEASAACKGHGGQALDLQAVVAPPGTGSYALTPVRLVQKFTSSEHGLAYCDAAASELRAHSSRPTSTFILADGLSPLQRVTDCVLEVAATTGAARVAVVADCGDHLRCYGFISAGDVDLDWWRASASHLVLEW